MAISSKSIACSSPMSYLLYQIATFNRGRAVERSKFTTKKTSEGWMVYNDRLRRLGSGVLLGIELPENTIGINVRWITPHNMLILPQLKKENKNETSC